MLIEEVFQAVFEKQKELFIKAKTPDEKPNIAVYMDYEFYSMCACEIARGPAGQTFEVIDTLTVLGYPIYRVPPMSNRHGEIRHPNYKVVNLNG